MFRYYRFDPSTCCCFATFNLLIRAPGTETIAAAKVGETGQSIRREDLNRIFEPFLTTRVSADRIGLGLPLAKKVLEDHKG